MVGGLGACYFIGDALIKKPTRFLVGYALFKRFYFAFACEQQEPVQGSVH